MTRCQIANQRGGRATIGRAAAGQAGWPRRGRASEVRRGSDAQVPGRGVHLRNGSDARPLACGCGGVHLREREIISLCISGTFLTCTPTGPTCASEGQMRATAGRPPVHMYTCAPAPTQGVHLTAAACRPPARRPQPGLVPAACTTSAAAAPPGRRDRAARRARDPGRRGRKAEPGTPRPKPAILSMTPSPFRSRICDLGRTSQSPRTPRRSPDDAA